MNKELEKEFDELWFLNFPKETGLGMGKFEQKTNAMNVIFKAFIDEHFIEKDIEKDPK